ncbi:hypothetical protein QFZ27_006392 [Inquilinus ginsengisoli]|uniref:hypothetical protein n=1 Tax=Inquilinus ginsengisoli TaxID=363840 RepID=UPI003D2457F3
MLCSMDMPQSDSDEIKATDPDMHWTGWALDALRELVQSDLRTKRMIERQQDRTPAGPDTPDFGLTQSRLSRSVRLSLAMTERIRTDYLMRKTERKASGEQERRRQRREQAAEAVVQAVTQPEDIDDIEHMRKLVRETLVEDEILDVQIDTLSPEAFLQAVCRKIGRPPHPIRSPHDSDDVAETEAESTEADDREPAEGWPHPPDESGAGRPTPKPAEPDSS